MRERPRTTSGMEPGHETYVPAQREGLRRLPSRATTLRFHDPRSRKDRPSIPPVRGLARCVMLRHGSPRDTSNNDDRPRCASAIVRTTVTSDTHVGPSPGEPLRTYHSKGWWPGVNLRNANALDDRLRSWYTALAIQRGCEWVEVETPRESQRSKKRECPLSAILPFFRVGTLRQSIRCRSVTRSRSEAFAQHRAISKSPETTRLETWRSHASHHHGPFASSGHTACSRRVARYCGGVQRRTHHA